MIFFQNYMELYPNSSLKPKGHYFTHYSTDTRKFGPLVKTLRFESKHSYFKNCIANSKNRINPCFSMATHHQMLMYLYYKEELYFNDDIKLTYAKEIELDDLPSPHSEIVSKSVLLSGSKMFQATKVTYQGQIYFIGGQ